MKILKEKFNPISKKAAHFLHGADYNPEQWKSTKEVWDEDMRLMDLSHCNVMSLGIFSWVSLEPEEGKFDFTWLDEIMDKLAATGKHIILATPSGARPAWLSQKYPEVLRVQNNRVRILHGKRHNHCYTSPVYREKTKIINQKLAQRYKEHPALILWHISNEYGGECHCDLCQQAFREWLKNKYNNDLDQLNQAWWNTFWSHTYTRWSQIESPAPHGESLVHGHSLDWKRFVTDQTTDFMKHEISTIREISQNIPITSNFTCEYSQEVGPFMEMGIYTGLNYWKMAPFLDVVSWDNYPHWHDKQDYIEKASSVAFILDINRCLKDGQPFMLMESNPVTTNWQHVSKLKRPGMHVLSCLQAVAHGSDTVQYFQWRSGRGCSEKFHGAVVDHSGQENTRNFKAVTDVGTILKKLDSVVGTTTRPEVAIIYDIENRWALDDSKGPRNKKKDYEQTCKKHYQIFWEKGISVDVINMDCDFSRYKLLIAPMLYLVKPNVAARIDEFVNNGGTFVTTYWSGIVNENDLCFLGGFPGPLRKVTGIRSEEVDALYDDESNEVYVEDENSLGLKKSYRAVELCDLIHTETAKSLATYNEDFYKGRPALTVNNYGNGNAYYIAFKSNDDFLMDFYTSIIENLSLKKVIEAGLPKGVTAQMRTDGKSEFIFILNFSNESKIITLDQNTSVNIISKKRRKYSY